jgi:hypothetical protein
MIKPALAIAALCLCAACGGTPEPADDARAVAPPSSAAEHNNAKKRCAAQPESVRAQCEQEANAAFSEAREDLSRLRGNTP